MTTAERLIEKGRQEGLQEGRQEGLQEGRQEGLQEARQEAIAEGERTLLSRQLKLKFGPLPGDALSRIEQADCAQLEQWAERMLGAESLDDVLRS